MMMINCRNHSKWSDFFISKTKMHCSFPRDAMVMFKIVFFEIQNEKNRLEIDLRCTVESLAVWPSSDHRAINRRVIKVLILLYGESMGSYLILISCSKIIKVTNKQTPPFSVSYNSAPHPRGGAKKLNLTLVPQSVSLIRILIAPIKSSLLHTLEYLTSHSNGNVFLYKFPIDFIC